MIKVDFESDGVSVQLFTGAGPATAKVEYGEGFDKMKEVPEFEYARIGKLITLAIQTLALNDAHAAAKWAKAELDKDGPQIVVPDKSLVVPG